MAPVFVSHVFILLVTSQLVEGAAGYRCDYNSGEGQREEAALYGKWI